MKSYDPTDEDCRAEADSLHAEPWMLEAMAKNPGYTGWGPGEDYMSSTDADEGWDRGQTVASWSDFDWSLDGLNICANFYFAVNRPSMGCKACGQTGYNPKTREISKDFYAFGQEPYEGWCKRITPDEADALVTRGRLWDFSKGQPGDPSGRELAGLVNASGGGTGVHDGINRYILIETRAKRLGVYGKCDHCHGNGYVYTTEKASLSLTLWILHPRKGASRGVIVKSISQGDLPAVYAWLREAAKQNAEIFSKIQQGNNKWKRIKPWFTARARSSRLATKKPATC